MKWGFFVRLSQELGKSAWWEGEGLARAVTFVSGVDIGGFVFECIADPDVFSSGEVRPNDQLQC